MSVVAVVVVVVVGVGRRQCAVAAVEIDDQQTETEQVSPVWGSPLLVEGVPYPMRLSALANHSEPSTENRRARQLDVCWTLQNSTKRHQFPTETRPGQ